MTTATGLLTCDCGAYLLVENCTCEFVASTAVDLEEEESNEAQEAEMEYRELRNWVERDNSISFFQLVER